MIRGWSYKTYPLRTPRTRLSMKNEPNTMSGTKYIQLNVEPRASLVYKTREKLEKHFTTSRVGFQQKASLNVTTPRDNINDDDHRASRSSQRSFFISLPVSVTSFSIHNRNAFMFFCRLFGRDLHRMALCQSEKT
jgi:hypothetical protein